MSPSRAARLLKQKKWWIVFVTLLVFLVKHQDNWSPTTGFTDSVSGNQTEWRSGQMVEAQGTVIKQLPTDNHGSRHQRWLMRVAGKQKTVLVAHNIDLAPMVPIRQGDTVRVFGQYEANDKGGVVHWTHTDPGGRHTDGWVKHKGKTYQ